MIWESHFWKDDLLKHTATLRKRATQRRWSEVSHARLEQTLMIGFYSIRKLHEAAKLSTAIMTDSVALTTYPWLGKNVTKLNWHKLEQLYDFASPKSENRDVLFVCHQFVHSFVFSAVFDENNGLQGIMFASDRQRHVSLLHITIAEVITLFETVGNDYPNQVSYQLNSKTGDYDVESIMMQSVS